MLQWTNATSLISIWGKFSLLLSFVILLSVIPSNFIISGIISSRKYPSLILNVIMFSVLFTYILNEGLSTFYVFLKYTENSLECLI